MYEPPNESAEAFASDDWFPIPRLTLRSILAIENLCGAQRVHALFNGFIPFR